MIIAWFIERTWIIKISILIALCIGLLYLNVYISDKRDLHPISEALGINSWTEFDKYIEETFEEGMVREDVYKELKKFKHYKITSTTWGTKDTSCELIGLPTGNPVIYSKLEYLACFSRQDDILISWALND